jgi:hypothetical protein
MIAESSDDTASSTASGERVTRNTRKNKLMAVLNKAEGAASGRTIAASAMSPSSSIATRSGTMPPPKSTPEVPKRQTRSKSITKSAKNAPSDEANTSRSSTNSTNSSSMTASEESPHVKPKPLELTTTSQKEENDESASTTMDKKDLFGEESSASQGRDSPNS